MKKLAILIFLFSFNFLTAQNANAEYYPSGVQLDVSEQTLIDNGWVKFYEETYATPISASASELRPSETYTLFTGKQVGSNTLLVLAAAPTSDVFTSTAKNTPQLLNGTYWYFADNTLGNTGSIGFAPNSVINQNSADIQNTSDRDRISWHIDYYEGGWRLGCIHSFAGSCVNEELNSSTGYLKQVWSWNGVRGVAAAPAPKKVEVEEPPKRKTTNLLFEKSMEGTDTLSDPTGELREIVDLAMRGTSPNAIARAYSNLLK